MGRVQRLIRHCSYSWWV